MEGLGLVDERSCSLMLVLSRYWPGAYDQFLQPMCLLTESMVLTSASCAFTAEVAARANPKYNAREAIVVSASRMVWRMDR